MAKYRIIVEEVQEDDQLEIDGVVQEDLCVGREIWVEGESIEVIVK